MRMRIEMMVMVIMMTFRWQEEDEGRRLREERKWEEER